jgi:hypothetical protein
MSSQITNSNSEAAILARVIQAEEGALSRSAAEYLLSVRFGERDVASMNELSELARQGKLTTQEQAELACLSFSVRGIASGDILQSHYYSTNNGGLTSGLCTSRQEVHLAKIPQGSPWQIYRK